jgi:hypothetical protein
MLNLSVLPKKIRKILTDHDLFVIGVVSQVDGNLCSVQVEKLVAVKDLEFTIYNNSM